MIGIVGGGVAGLIAAINLESAGFQCLLVEKAPHLGGRVATDTEAGAPLDHGFQVLLTDYPYAQKYLDYEALNLKNFEPGAVVFKNGKRSKFGDPVRDIFHLFPTLFSWVGSLSDKTKIYSLSRTLLIKKIEEIWTTPEISTLKYLQNYGFSDKIITNFFKPFFGGIFLEAELSTSSRMFEFVFRMFADGSAAIPAAGMKAIPEQLATKLKKTDVHLNITATITDSGTLMIAGKEVLVEGIIDATNNAQEEWHACTTYYYEVDKRVLKGNIIGLDANPDSAINSFHYVQDNILSVTSLTGPQQGDIDLKIKRLLGLENVELIKEFHIKKSLPVLKQLGENPADTLTHKQNTPLVKAGDHLYYGSLNAAMLSGERAAEKLITSLKK